MSELQNLTWSFPVAEIKGFVEDHMVFIGPVIYFIGGLFMAEAIIRMMFRIIQRATGGGLGSVGGGGGGLGSVGGGGGLGSVGGGGGGLGSVGGGGGGDPLGGLAGSSGGLGSVGGGGGGLGSVGGGFINHFINQQIKEAFKGFTENLNDGDDENGKPQGFINDLRSHFSDEEWRDLGVVAQRLRIEGVIRTKPDRLARIILKEKEGGFKALTHDEIAIFVLMDRERERMRRTLSDSRPTDGDVADTPVPFSEEHYGIPSFIPDSSGSIADEEYSPNYQVVPRSDGLFDFIDAPAADDDYDPYWDDPDNDDVYDDDYDDDEW